MSRSGPWNPAVAAKQIATIHQLYGGRVAVNVVSGWFRGEFTAIGEPWLDHDERYRRSEEFIRALRGIWTEDNFTSRRDFYRLNTYPLKPKPQHPWPEIFQGGSSRGRGARRSVRPGRRRPDLALRGWRENERRRAAGPACAAIAARPPPTAPPASSP